MATIQKIKSNENTFNELPKEMTGDMEIVVQAKSMSPQANVTLTTQLSDDIPCRNEAGKKKGYWEMTIDTLQWDPAKQNLNEFFIRCGKYDYLDTAEEKINRMVEIAKDILNTHDIELTNQVVFGIKDVDLSEPISPILKTRLSRWRIPSIEEEYRGIDGHDERLLVEIPISIEDVPVSKGVYFITAEELNGKPTDIGETPPYCDMDEMRIETYASGRDKLDEKLDRLTGIIERLTGEKWQKGWSNIEEAVKQKEAQLEKKNIVKHNGPKLG